MANAGQLMVRLLMVLKKDKLRLMIAKSRIIKNNHQ